MKQLFLLTTFYLVCLMAQTAGGHSNKPSKKNFNPKNGCKLIQEEGNAIEARTDVSLNSIWDGKLLML